MNTSVRKINDNPEHIALMHLKDFIVNKNNDLVTNCPLTGEEEVVAPAVMINPRYLALIKKSPSLYKALSSVISELVASCEYAEKNKDYNRIDSILDVLHDLYFLRNEILNIQKSDESE